MTDQTPLLQQLLSERILILDGAMGTMLQRKGLEESDFRGERLANHPVPLFGNNDLLSLTRPDVIREVYRAYLHAGADLIETNTFNATTISQADYQTEHLAHEINFEAARLARLEVDAVSTADRPRFVVGAIGPTARSASMSPDVEDPGARAHVTFHELSLRPTGKRREASSTAVRTS